MHTIIIYGVLVWIVALLGVCVALIVRGRTLLMRVLGLETFTMVLAALLTLFGITTGSATYLDAVLILALLSFVGTVVAARYASEDQLFP